MLVVVLLVICVLSLLVAQMAISTLTDLELTRARSRTVQLRAALDSGVSLARTMLAADQESRSGVDSLEDAWSQGPIVVRFDDAVVTLSIRDEDSKVSLPHLMKSWSPGDAREIKKRLRHFVHQASGVFKLPEDDIRRWIVAHQFRLGLPEELAARPLFSVPHASTGADSKQISKVEDLLTVWTDGSLNVNTVSLECLRYLWGQKNERFIEAVLSHREQEPFVRPEEVFALPGAARALGVPQGILLSTTSAVFTIEVEAVDGPSRLCQRAIVTRAEAGVPVVFRQTVPDLTFVGEPREMDIEAFADSGSGPEDGDAAHKGRTTPSREAVFP